MKYLLFGAVLFLLSGCHLTVHEYVEPEPVILVPAHYPYTYYPW